MSSPRGFVDVQNNGWMGTDFTEPGLTLDRVRAITRDLVARGTLAYCPTLITGRPEVYRENMAVFARACRDPEIGPRILGIHLEGPFISPTPGASGAHPRDCVLVPDIKTFERFQEWAEGHIRILTVAPEQPGCLDLIRHASRRGVVVSMGHHMAGTADLEAAVEAGATLCTHVGNGIPNEIHRHRNPLWWQLACDRLSCMFITDGHHIPADFIKVALRAKSPRRFVVTSDASPLAGLPPGRYKTFGGLPVVIDPTGLIYSAETKSLVGSHSTMLECMNHLASLDLLTERQLWTVGLLNPLRLLGKKPSDLAGLKGPEVVFEKGRFRIRGRRRS